MMLSGEGSTSSISKKKSQQSNNIVNLRPKKKIKSLHELFLEILDAVLSCVIVAPCVIAYWRGTWELMGVLLFPRSMPLSALMSFLIGLSGHFFFTITQSFFRSYIHPDKRRLTYYVISRSYTALFGIVCVNMWRGSWILCDWLTSADSLIIIAAVTLVSLMFLIATRTVRNLSAAPYAVTMDHKSDYFDVDTMFKIPILGYITVVITFVIRPIIRCICKKIDGICKLIICDVFYFLIFFGAVNAWRGIWNLLDIYLYPDNKILSYWLTHLIPFLVLAALKCSNSILVRGVFIDAEGTPDECVTIPINYIKLHFERERKKKSIYICHQTDMMKKANKDAQINLIEKSEKAEIKIQAGRDAAGHV
ncbi:uncharacterized protein LOC105219245 isoform X4 [Zeugodacus cucurbitae]|uniref:uncharacterized protein LOC105219245 isoform X4 n=1 Tax=Zeugodacus cucurbitae TaxID=28588 RepID=UPI0010A74A26|nr:uncharacterized protein LOC105219245 isoform X4 [Zeugodacus cucurbitae]